MPLVIVHSDKASSAVLSGGDWVSSLPLSNVKTPDIRSVARTVSSDNSDTYINVDLGEVASIGGIVIGPINMSPGATWRVVSYEDFALTTVLYDSGLIQNSGSVIDWTDPNDYLEWEHPNFWLGQLETDLDELPLYLVHIVPLESSGLATAQYWSLEFFDEANADGHLDIGRVYMGPVYRPSVNYAEGSEFTFEPITDVTESLGGLRTYWHRGLRRTLRCSWPRIPESEAFSDWYRMMIKHRTDRQFFVVPEEDDEPDMIRKRAILATYKQIPTIQQLVYQDAAVAFDAEEVL
jgi:hypothetical protein